MAKLFLSHSKKDREFAEKLARDLRELNHSVWFDEWEIRVGDCIASGIEAGIDEAEFIVLVLSPHSVESNWVEREWKAKYWEEVEKGKVRVLPALLEECDIPALLRTKYYADFRTSYGAGIARLNAALSPTVGQTGGFMLLGAERSRLSELIERTQSGSERLL